MLYPLTAAIIFAWFFFFTWKSLSLYFDSDDMMNLYLAWSKPLAEVYRPVGALFYRGLFALGGFNPMPFRIACLAIGVANIGLCWWFLRLVSGSDRVTALALLPFAFHTRLMEVWWRNAVVYDLLCFTFFYLAVCLYVSVRKAGHTPGLARRCAILACFLCALGAKENALALPLVLLAYELLFQGIRWRNLGWPSALAVLDIPYLYFKTHGAAAMASLAGYAPEYTVRHFIGAWGRFLGYLLVRDQDLEPWVAASILMGLLAVAVAARSRTLTLAWLILFLAPLPVAFIAYRGGYVLYTAYPGAVLYAAVVLVAAKDFTRRKHHQYRTALACAVFVLATWRWGKLNLHDQASTRAHGSMKAPRRFIRWPVRCAVSRRDCPKAPACSFCRMLSLPANGHRIYRKTALSRRYAGARPYEDVGQETLGLERIPVRLRLRPRALQPAQALSRHLSRV